MDFKLGLDEYSRNARLKPALLTVLPLAWTVLVLWPGGAGIWSGVLSLSLACGGSYLLAQLGWDWGKLKESSLFDQIGGRPTERMLSHARASNKAMVQRWHQGLKALIPDLKIPSQ